MPDIDIEKDDGSDDLDPSIPDLDISLYVILDTSDSKYHDRLRPFSKDLDKYNGFFIPRLNKEGTKCLVQLKVESDKYKWLQATLDSGVIGIGNITWAIAEMNALPKEWGKAYNDWKTHRDFLTETTDKLEYETKLEEGRIELGTIIVKIR